jgi:SNF family Na+-dependent transporter
VTKIKKFNDFDSFSAVFPIIVLFIFFVYGLTLDGAADGIVYYVKPDFEKLKDFNVWSAAASQVTILTIN